MIQSIITIYLHEMFLQQTQTYQLILLQGLSVMDRCHAIIAAEGICFSYHGGLQVT